MDADKVVEQISQLAQSVESQKLWQDGDRLSQLCVKLASLLAYLSDSIALAELNTTQAETLYKFQRDERVLKYLADKYSVEKAKAQTNVDLSENYSAYLIIQNQARILNLKRVDTNNLIDAMRSRLSYMKSEMTNA